MNKAFLTILSILYLFTASGATVYSHYCMGKLVEVGFEKGHEKECGKCGMEKDAGDDDGCCKEEHKFISGEKAQKAAFSSALDLPLFDVHAQPYVSDYLIRFNSVVSQLPYSKAPPRTGKVSVFVQNCVFRI